MLYIFGQLGYSLPRTANDQMNATRRISRSEAVPGDLVFILSGGRAYHMGMFAGGNMFYDAGRTGRVFSKREIFSSDVVFGRVG
jgi:cell wall-associated NlpC family hydrolase